MTSSGEVSATGSPAGTPINTQAPKYGTLIPNRIFVGGIAANTTDQEIKQFFAAYGAVKDCKIIADRAGVSKGYGFVTFECQEDAEKIIKTESDNLVFKDRKLNIGPAIRKQQAFPGPRLYDSGAIMYTNGVPYTFQNGMAVFNPQEGYPVPAQPQPSYPVVMGSSPMYTLNQAGTGYTYPSQSVGGSSLGQWTGAAAAAAAAAGQWRWTAQSPVSAMTANSQYNMYHPVLHPGHGEMIYTQPATQTGFGGDIADASMLEAAAQPSEGSTTMEVSTPQRHYAECSGMSTADLLHHHAASTPLMKSPLAYATGVKCHIGNIYATPPPTPSPLAPIKVLTNPHHIMASPPMLTAKDRNDLSDDIRRHPMTPPMTPQTKMSC